ncbi:hypothetical protein [Singulisphaera sp. PoT]|uniref:hypothetical protein n=1 Tax=Singulisphaera sp. PoT TaxID=3411797 RepID=UPI003BF5DC9B
MAKRHKVDRVTHDLSDEPRRQLSLALVPPIRRGLPPRYVPRRKVDAKLLEAIGLGNVPVSVSHGSPGWKYLVKTCIRERISIQMRVDLVGVEGGEG